MTYKAIVVADSVADGVRLTSLEVTFPRFILAEFNTHRALSRNSASSRAIPVRTRVQQVREAPFVPEAFTRNKSGMQADGVLIDDDARNAEALWLGSARQAADVAYSMDHTKVHKQHANRILEPYVWHTVIVTATEWDNFFALRDHPAAQPEMQITARKMKAAMDASIPRYLLEGEWHLPYVDGLVVSGLGSVVKVSVARCAALSYERQYAQKTVEEYVARHDEMMRMGHWSPFEHQAKVATDDEIFQNAYFKYKAKRHGLEAVCIGNFAVPWFQYRKMIPGEDVFQG